MSKIIAVWPRRADAPGRAPFRWMPRRRWLSAAVPFPVQRHAPVFRRRVSHSPKRRAAATRQDPARVCAGLVRAALIWVALGIGAKGHAADADCGRPDTPCAIAGGQYRIVLPDGGAGRPDGIPALMFLHGWGSSGGAVLRMSDLIDTARARGYAVIAPDGVPRATGSGFTWGFHPDRPGPRDEIAFLRAVRDDAAARHGIDGTRVILAGFSIGGSMTSYLACAAPDTFAAYAPVAGAFWVPHPDTCAGPVDLLHTHGWADPVVPLEGRILRDGGSAGVVAQADVWQAMHVWRAANGCRPDPDSHGQTGIFRQRDWTSCAMGKRLGFALFDGGHTVPQTWTDMALDWAEGR